MIKFFTDPVRCHHCHRRVWPWQSTCSWGQIGFKDRDADFLAHDQCVEERRREREERSGESD